jgi:hypothetical protein
MLRACLEWLDDWTQSLDAPIVDTYDLATWMEEEGCEAILFFLQTAFRKQKTRSEALGVIAALLWEHFLTERQRHIDALALKPDQKAVWRLQALPQTPQKSAAWYAEARNLLTGHEFAGVVYGTETAFRSAVARKCCPEIVVDPAAGPMESRTVYTSPLSPFQWGWRYEDVIRNLYEAHVAAAPVDDSLGRIRHPHLPRLAASPDGLICGREKAGRLLEIKAPITRLLTGELPQDYYCQIQLQAEVADVAAVEYIEVRFDAHVVTDETKDAFDTHTFLQAPKFLSPDVPAQCGAVLVMAQPESEEDPETWIYAYSPLQDLTEAGLAKAMSWVPRGEDKGAGWICKERCIWRIADVWTTTVLRNRRWWAEVGQPAYERFWVAVDAARADGRYAATCLIVDDDAEDVGAAEGAIDEPKENSSACLIADEE